MVTYWSYKPVVSHSLISCADFIYTCRHICSELIVTSRPQCSDWLTYFSNQRNSGQLPVCCHFIHLLDFVFSAFLFGGLLQSEASVVCLSFLPKRLLPGAVNLIMIKKYVDLRIVLIQSVQLCWFHPLDHVFVWMDCTCGRWWPNWKVGWNGCQIAQHIWNAQKILNGNVEIWN